MISIFVVLVVSSRILELEADGQENERKTFMDYLWSKQEETWLLRSAWHRGKSINIFERYEKIRGTSIILFDKSGS